MATQAPYGDIVQIGTPYIDRASAILYQEQRQREALRQRQAEQLNNEFKAMMPGIRSADTSKLAELYNNYKTSWQQLQANPPKNQADFLKAQQDLLQKKAALYNHPAGSKETAVAEKQIGSAIANDKNGIFRDDAHEILMQGMKQPYDQPYVNVINPETGKKEQIDWRNIDSYKRNIDTKGVMDAIKYSTGTDQKYSGDKYKEKPTDLQYTQPEITVKNKPTQFYENMKLAATKDPKSFLNTLPHPSDEDYFNVEKHYNEVMTPEMRKSWRMSDGEDLPPDENLTDLERAIKYQAMTHALNNPPRVINKNVNDEVALLAARQKNSIERLHIYAGIKDQEPENIGRNVDGLISDHISSARNNGGQVLVDDATWEALTGQKSQSKNSVLMVDEQGNYKYGRKDENGAVVPESLKPIPYSLAKTKLTQKYKSGLDKKYNTGGTSPNIPKPAPHKQVKVAGL